MISTTDAAGGLRRLIEINLPYWRTRRFQFTSSRQACRGCRFFSRKGPAIDAIIASAAIPGIFPAVQIDGQMLIDGAIAANTPIRVAADLGASRIIVLPTGYACALKEFPKGSLARHLHSMTLLIAWQLIRDLDWCPDEIDVSVVPPLCPLDV